MTSPIQTIATALLAARRIVVFTGAGMSAESGIAMRASEIGDSQCRQWGDKIRRRLTNSHTTFYSSVEAPAQLVSKPALQNFEHAPVPTPYP